MRTLGLTYVTKNFWNESNHFSYSCTKDNVILISNYDYLIEFNSYNSSYNSTSKYEIDSLRYNFTCDLKEKNSLTFLSKDDTMTFGLNQMLDELKHEYGTNESSNIDIDKNKMVLHGTSKAFKIKIEISSLNIQLRNDSTIINSIQGRLYLKNRK